MSTSLWPSFAGMAPPRGMREMLTEAAGGIGPQTSGKLQFYIDTLGVSAKIEKIRHNCYLRVPATGYTHLLFQVSTPVPGPFPAEVATPEGDQFPNIQDENQLRDAIKQVLQRERTKEVVLYLLSTVP